MSIVQNPTVVETSDLQTELHPYNDMQNQIKRLQAQLGDLKGKSSDTQCASNTLDPLSQKLKNENVELEFQVIPKVGESNALSKPVTSNSAPSSRESIVVNNERVIAPGIFRINHFKASRGPRKLASPTLVNLDLALGGLHRKDFFDLKGKIIASSESESPSDCSKGVIDVLLTLRNLSTKGFQVQLSLYNNPFFKEKENVRFSAFFLNNEKRNLFGLELVSNIQSLLAQVNELESLFGHLFDELSNGENQVVSKSSAVTTADASDTRQQQPDSTSSTPTLATTITADGNFDL
ncbi:hypothetical protein Tco_0872099 [Tanacetum coccineum]